MALGTGSTIMMYTMWFYGFREAMAKSTLDKLRIRGADKLYPGADADGGTFLGRVWGEPLFNYASVFRRKNIAAARAEAEDAENLLLNLRILSPALATLQVRNYIERDDEELETLGDDEWHRRLVEPFIAAAKAIPEIDYHLNVIGMNCVRSGTFPPYPVQAVWRAKFGFEQKWFGGREPRAHWPSRQQRSL